MFDTEHMNPLLAYTAAIPAVAAGTGSLAHGPRAWGYGLGEE